MAGERQLGIQDGGRAEHQGAKKHPRAPRTLYSMAVLEACLGCPLKGELQICQMVPLYIFSGFLEIAAKKNCPALLLYKTQIEKDGERVQKQQ